MKHLYTILMALSLVTQVVATPLSEVEEEPQWDFTEDLQAVTTTKDVAQETSLSQWVGIGKTAAFLAAEVSMLSILLHNYDEVVPVWFLGSCLGFGLGILETVMKRGRNLSSKQALARELMIAAPAIALPVLFFTDYFVSHKASRGIGGFSGLLFFGGALWSLKDWYQRWRNPEAGAEAQASEDPVWA